jgi:hypothetical protein
VSFNRSVCWSACLAALSVCLSVGQSVCRFVYLTIFLYACLSVCLSVGRSVGRSAGRSVSQSVFLSVSQSFCLSVCLSISLSVSLFLSISVCPLCLCAHLPVCLPGTFHLLFSSILIKRLGWREFPDLIVNVSVSASRDVRLPVGNCTRSVNVNGVERAKGSVVISDGKSLVGNCK